MLRTSLRSAQAVGRRSLAAPAARSGQWPSAALVARRSYADIKDSTPAKLPTTETVTAAGSKPPIPKVDAAAPVKDVPLTPPTPDASTILAANSKTTPPPPPPPAPAPIKKKKGFFRRLRNFIVTLSLLGALTFGGGVWYSRINDNFYDFFTEFVPFGEQAVLYLEELELRKKHPRPLLGSGVKDNSPQVKIAPQSGASWRVADSGEPAGRQSSAASNASNVKQAAVKKVEQVKDSAKSGAEKVKQAVTSAVEPAAPTKTSAVPFKAPEVDEPSRFPPASPIDPLSVRDADEPVVQALTKMLNDIITVVNADNADARFSNTIGKAKIELNKIGDSIREIKAQVEKDAAAEVAGKITEFKNASGELMNSVERIMAAQESQWRTDFEEEMKRIQTAYDSRIKTEIEREQVLNEEKLKNKLIEQAIELKRHFLADVKTSVEAERGARLGKLDQLTSSVKELENLTTGWNDVVDLNLRTQQLHVAVEAVRASLEDAAHPRPFVRELVALKEIATDDPVVNAAIASINPGAYQRGISPPAQLIDRFRRVAAEVRKASLLPEDAGVASHASSLLLSKVMFKKQGLADGKDVESILTRTQTFLEEGDLDAAAREMNSLQGWAKTLSRDWLGEVRKVLEVQQALDVISTEARLQSLKVE